MTASRFSVSRETTLKARKLRREATPFEKKVWARLNRGQAGWRFRRQHPVGPYILDFYCPALRLCVEVDGDSHGDEKGMTRDAARTTFLEARGIVVIRFWNSEIRENVVGVVERIMEACRAIAKGREH